MNPFEVLNIAPCLVINREELNRAFREAGKSVHPDLGGTQEAFARLQAAVDVLSSPARRLKAWLELKGVVVESRGTISSELMDEFGRVGEVTQRAESVIRKREAALSALAKAMLEGETQLCREKLEEAMSRIEVLIGRITAGFEALESDSSQLERAVEWHRDLTFLEKWQASLRALFSRLL